MTDFYEQEFDTIPSLHRTYADIGTDGYWVYWDQLPNGKYKWNPRWEKIPDAPSLKRSGTEWHGTVALHMDGTVTKLDANGDTGMSVK